MRSSNSGARTHARTSARAATRRSEKVTHSEIPPPWSRGPGAARGRDPDRLPTHPRTATPTAASGPPGGDGGAELRYVSHLLLGRSALTRSAASSGVFASCLADGDRLDDSTLNASGAFSRTGSRGELSKTPVSKAQWYEMRCV